VILHDLTPENGEKEIKGVPIFGKHHFDPFSVAQCWSPGRNLKPEAPKTDPTAKHHGFDRFSVGYSSLSPTTRPGKQTVCELENGPVEIVDLPIKQCDFPSFFVCLSIWVTLFFFRYRT